MSFFGVCFFLYFIKLSGGNVFFLIRLDIPEITVESMDSSIGVICKIED
jgi:hypothetical protein